MDITLKIGTVVSPALTAVQLGRPRPKARVYHVLVTGVPEGTPLIDVVNAYRQTAILDAAAEARGWRVGWAELGAGKIVRAEAAKPSPIREAVLATMKARGIDTPLLVQLAAGRVARSTVYRYVAGEGEITTDAAEALLDVLGLELRPKA